MKTKDLFSTVSPQYAQFRPTYPMAVFDYLAGLVIEHELAWDCATGNGQAAWMLTKHFDQVIATDLSKEQLSHALHHQKILYRVATAESSELKDHSVDLITVAQAFHWFDPHLFAAEVKRVAKKNGVLAIWCYGLVTITEEVDRLIAHLYDDVLKGFWEPERKLVDNNYRDISMPFLKLPELSFAMTAEWTLLHLTGYLRTWSAYKTFIIKMGSDPLDPLLSHLKKAWGNESSRRKVSWVITPKIWRV